MPRTPPVPVSNVTREQYHAMVERAKEYILAGDIFQVVPSQRFTVPFELPPFSLYRALRRLNPSPFLFYLDFDDFALVGSSPEILVRLQDDMVTIRPLAGTRPRGATRDEDARLAADLLADPKELAEHLMLLDLGRNDVGRVAEIGTVRVTEKMVVEYYSHVMHIVSNVEGRIRAECRRARGPDRGLPRRHGERRAEGPGDADHRRAGAGAARLLRGRASATSAPTATWTPASRCAPPWSRTARCTSRRAAAWSPTATPRPSTRRAATRPAP